MNTCAPVVRVGLTGGIASGKSTVADLMARRGARLVDADLLSREVIAPGTDGWAAVLARFGERVVGRDSDGQPLLDRSALGRIVFGDPVARRDLEQIIHPRVRSRAAELVAAAPAGSVVVQVIPLLVETGQSDDFDLLVVVDVPVQTQLDRLMRRNGLSRSEAEQRLAAQATREERLAVADWVIDNSGSPAQTERQVDELMARLHTAAGGAPIPGS